MRWSPVDYAASAVIAREVENEMLARLDWMTLKPALVWNAGSGVGEVGARLQQRYPKARVISADASMAMIAYTKEQHQRSHCVCAAETQLPLAEASVDLLFANLRLPWHDDMIGLLREWRRVLAPEGLLMLSAFGLNTLQEYHTVIAPQHMPQLFDMHDIGDALLQAGLIEPVLDVSHFTLLYQDQHKLVQELQQTGMLLSDTDTLRDAIMRVGSAPYAVTYEVIYAHAFVGAARALTTSGEVHIDVATLRRQLEQQKNEK